MSHNRLVVLIKYCYICTLENSYLINNLNETVRSLREDGTAGGATYIRWGRTTCPTDTGAQLLYDGYATGGNYAHAGGGVNYLCLPKDPIYGPDVTEGGRGVIYGAEYQTHGTVMDDLSDDDVPCAVCQSTRRNVIMIPGRNQCYKNWTLEYKGYLMSSYYEHPGSKEYVCMDDQPETLASGAANQNGALFYLVEGRCGSLQCPPYIDGQEITCAVCSYRSSDSN